MLNSAAAGRRLALRAAVYQSAAVLLVAVAFLLQGKGAALGVLMGGGSLIAGGALSARLALGGGVLPAGVALGRLLLAMISKWCVVILVLALALAGGLPAIPLLAGVGVATAAFVATHSIKR